MKDLIRQRITIGNDGQPHPFWQVCLDGIEIGRAEWHPDAVRLAHKYIADLIEQGDEEVPACTG